MSKPNGILAMDPENYREIDGVVFDLDSYEKHCAPAEPALEPEPEVPAKPIPIPEGILAMNPAHYHAIDGVAMDEDSFARHKQPPAATEPEPEEVVVDEPTPTGVFAVDPYPDGWYPAEDGQPPIPIMGGALPPVEILENGVHVITVTRTVFLHTGSGSGSGSYVTSYTTSYRTSYLSSGSGSYVFGSCTYLVGGYGLELV